MIQNLINSLIARIASLFASVAARNFDALAALTGGKTTQDMGKEVKAIIANLNRQAGALVTEAEKISKDAQEEYDKAVEIAGKAAAKQRKISEGKTAEAKNLVNQSEAALKTLKFFGIDEG